MTPIRRVTVAVLCACVSVVPLVAQTQKPRPKAPAVKAVPAGAPTTASIVRSVNAKELEKSLAAINVDRTAGKEGERKAAAYVEQALTGWNVKFTRSEARVLLSWPGKAEVSLLGDTTGSMRAVAAAFGAATPPGGLTAEAVAINGPLDERGTNQDVRGKILVLPGPMTPEAVARAEQSPAIGLIFVSDSDALHEGSASPVWGTPTPSDRARLPRLPVVSVSKGSGDRLRSVIARGPLAVKLVAEVQQEWTDVPVIVADIPGSTPEYVLVTTHLDAWYEGMTDGGSGIVSLLEMARVLQPQRAKLRRGVRLAWWSGHAVGNFAGSTWYVDRLASELDRLCVAYMNVEDAGRKGSRIDGIVAGGWPAINEFARQTARTLVPKTSLPAADSAFRPERASDSSFQGLGISEIWAGVPGPVRPSGDVEPSGRIKYWHTRDDKLDKVDLKVLALDMQYRLAMVYELASAPVVPLQLGPLAAALVHAIDDANAAAGSKLDLAGVRAAATALATAAARVDAQAKPTRPDAIAALNHLLVRASHRLNSALYSRNGRFGQDAITSLPALPSLADATKLAKLAPDSEDFHFLETELLRARNALEAALRDVIDEMNAFLGVKTT